MSTEKHPSTDHSLICLSNEDIIESLQEHRNELINQLLEDDFLTHYLLDRYKVKNPSPVKLRFIKQRLIELSGTNIGMEHYSKLFKEIRKTDGSILSHSKEDLFHADIERAIKNFL